MFSQVFQKIKRFVFGRQAGLDCVQLVLPLKQLPPIEPFSGMQGLTSIDNFEEDEVTLKFSGDEAVILLEWLYKNDDDYERLVFEDRAEQWVLWQLEGRLEKQLITMFHPCCGKIIERAKKRIKNNLGEDDQDDHTNLN